MAMKGKLNANKTRIVKEINIIKAKKGIKPAPANKPNSNISKNRR